MQNTVAATIGHGGAEPLDLARHEGEAEIFPRAELGPYILR